MLTVRPLEPDDLDSWLPLYEAYLIFYKTEPDTSRMTSVFNRLLDEKSGIDGYAAVDETGQLLGITHYLFHANVKTPEPVCYLQDLFTVPQSRGKGVGRALIDKVHKTAIEKGASQTYWMTQEFNYPGRTLYDKVAERTPFIKYAKI